MSRSATWAAKAKARYEERTRNMSPEQQERIRLGKLNPDERRNKLFQCALRAWRSYNRLTPGVILPTNGSIMHHRV